MSFTDCRRTMGIMVGLACGVAMTTTVLERPAGADPRPTARDVSRARDQIRDRSSEVGRTAARLASAKARLDELAASAERSVETYNEALVRLAQAQDTYQQAVRRADDADRRVAEERRAVVVIATEGYSAGYGGVGLVRPVAAMMSGPGGMPGYLYRSSMLTHLGVGQAAILRRLRDAQRVAAIMRDQANHAYTEQRSAAARAESAKRAAESAVREQIEATRQIEVEKAVLEKRLERARSHADRLARARAAARERRRLRHIPARAKGRAAGALQGDVAADWALTQLGKPYVWAADGPDSYDCSGLTMRAWARAGIDLDHWTGTQWSSGPHVSLDDLRRGDLLFFGHISSDPGTIHHVGIYIGRGLMVHAPQTGDVVRIAPIWRRDLVGATRPNG